MNNEEHDTMAKIVSDMNATGDDIIRGFALRIATVFFNEVYTTADAILKASYNSLLSDMNKRNQKELK